MIQNIQVLFYFHIVLEYLTDILNVNILHMFYVAGTCMFLRFLQVEYSLYVEGL